MCASVCGLGANRVCGVWVCVCAHMCPCTSTDVCVREQCSVLAAGPVPTSLSWRLISSPGSSVLNFPFPSLSVWKTTQRGHPKEPGRSAPRWRPWVRALLAQVDGPAPLPALAWARETLGASRVGRAWRPPCSTWSVPLPTPLPCSSRCICRCLFSCSLARIDMIVGPPPPSTPRHKKYPTKGPTAPPRESPQYSPRSGCQPSPALSLWNGQPPSPQAT